jgi:hypothetical protein
MLPDRVREARIEAFAHVYTWFGEARQTRGLMQPKEVQFQVFGYWLCKGLALAENRVRMNAADAEDEFIAAHLSLRANLGKTLRKV